MAAPVTSSMKYRFRWPSRGPPPTPPPGYSSGAGPVSVSSVPPPSGKIERTSPQQPAAASAAKTSATIRLSIAITSAASYRFCRARVQREAGWLC